MCHPLASGLVKNPGVSPGKRPLPSAPTFVGSISIRRVDAWLDEFHWIRKVAGVRLLARRPSTLG